MNLPSFAAPPLNCNVIMVDNICRTFPCQCVDDLVIPLFPKHLRRPQLAKEDEPVEVPKKLFVMDQTIDKESKESIVISVEKI
jgi:hypothetical protein